MIECYNITLYVSILSQLVGKQIIIYLVSTPSSIIIYIIFNIPDEAALIHRQLHVMRVNVAVHHHRRNGYLHRHGGQRCQVPLTNPCHNVG